MICYVYTTGQQYMQTQHQPILLSYCLYAAPAFVCIPACVQNWLDLSLNRGLPSSLLLLSRAFTITSPMPGLSGAAGGADELGQIKETLLTLPEEVIKDVGLEVTAATTSEET